MNEKSINDILYLVDYVLDDSEVVKRIADVYSEIEEYKDLAYSAAIDEKSDIEHKLYEVQTILEEVDEEEDDQSYINDLNATIECLERELDDVEKTINNLSELKYHPEDLNNSLRTLYQISEIDIEEHIRITFPIATNGVGYDSLFTTIGRNFNNSINGNSSISRPDSKYRLSSDHRLIDYFKSGFLISFQHGFHDLYSCYDDFYEQTYELLKDAYIERTESILLHYNKSFKGSYHAKCDSVIAAVDEIQGAYSTIEIKIFDATELDAQYLKNVSAYVKNKLDNGYQYNQKKFIGKLKMTGGYKYACYIISQQSIHDVVKEKVDGISCEEDERNTLYSPEKYGKFNTMVLYNDEKTFDRICKVVKLFGGYECIFKYDLLTDLPIE